jgi:hypothetical protein
VIVPNEDRISITARCTTPDGIKRHDALPDTLIKLPRQHAISKSTRLSRYGPEIESRPFEPVQFRDDDPGTLAVEAQVVLDLPRYFDPLSRIFGWAVGNGDNSDFDFIVPGIRRDNYRARTVLPALVLPLVGLMGPEKRKRNDKAGFRPG